MSYLDINGLRVFWTKIKSWVTNQGYGTYSKPQQGIPKTDLSNSVQTSLSKADSALQTAPVTSVNSKTGAVSLTASDVGLGNVGNFKAVSTQSNQGLTVTEKENARTNIGAGTSSFSGNYTDLSNKPTIPTKVSQLTNDSGYTTNTGTITGITMNGDVKGTSGVVNLGVVLTEHQDLSNYAKTSDLTTHTGNTTVHITSTERTNWNAAKTHADSAHAPSNAEANQNAFSNVTVGSTTVAADSKTDTLTLAGSNVTLTPDATNDKITIGITKANVTDALGYTPPTTNTTYGAAGTSLGLVKSGGDVTISSGTITVNDDSHNHVISNVDGLQDALDAKGSASDVSNLKTLVGDTSVSSQITSAIANKADKTHTHDNRYYTESEIDTKLSGKSDTSHTHSSYVNQNAFSNVKVGSSTIAADSATDTLTLTAGNNVTLTADTSGDGVTIAAKDTVYTHPTTSGNKHIPSGGSSGQILRWSADGTAVWGADNNTTYSNATTSTAGLMSSSDKTKLDGIATGATKVTVDSALSSTSTNPVQNKVVNGAISNLNTLVGGTSVTTQINNAIASKADLDTNGKVPSSQLPSYVDDVLEYSAKSNFPSTGESGKIYVDTATNLTYRWSGSAYVEISPSLALGETSSTAYRGDRGKIAYDHSQTSHAPSNAEVNQNAFSNVKVGSTTVAADSKTDTLELVAGTNVTLTPDATNDKVTITAKDTTYSAATTDAAGLMSATDKTKLDGIATGANKTTVDSALSSTSTNPVQNKVVNTAISNLNTLVGDTAVSTQITNAIDEITPASIGAATSSHTHSDYASTSHTHNYAGSSSAGGAANSVANSMTVQLNSGTTEGTDKFTFNGSAAKSVNITPSTIGAAASSHGTHVSYSSTNPVMDGTASVGSASTVARSDHKHPTDTTRAAASDLTSHTGNTSNPHKVTAAQVGADPSGSASSALTSAKAYTDDEISEWVGDATVSAQIAAAAYTHPSYTARTGVPTANQTPAFGGTFSVNQINSDATGHVTAANSRTVTIPSTLSNGTETAGLIKTSSTVTSNSGYTACPVISGVPYYKDTNTTYTLSSFGITATAAELNALDGITSTVTELNYCDGVTSNIQTQLNGKASSSHNHSAANITAGTLAGSVVANTSAVSALTDKQIRNITISTSEPVNSQGVDGDIWVTYGSAQSNCPFPVGGIYISVSSTSPSSLWSGTTWERIGVGRTLISAGGDDNAVVDENTYTDRGTNIAEKHWFPVGEKGGEINHTLTTTEMPAHTHTIGSSGAHHHVSQGRQEGSGTGANIFESYNGASKTRSVNVPRTGDNGAHTHSPGSTGGDGAHNNMSTYLAVYMWKRVS